MKAFRKSCKQGAMPVPPARRRKPLREAGCGGCEHCDDSSEDDSVVLCDELGSSSLERPNGTQRREAGRRRRRKKQDRDGCIVLASFNASGRKQLHLNSLMQRLPTTSRRTLPSSRSIARGVRNGKRCKSRLKEKDGTFEDAPLCRETEEAAQRGLH